MTVLHLLYSLVVWYIMRQGFESVWNIFFYITEFREV